MWTEVNVGFNAEEETVNFGTRACAVNDVAVYETNTLAAIHAGEEKPNQNPKVQSQYFQGVGLFVAIDSSLAVFNEDCSIVKCVITFPTNIEVFTVSSCGSFLIVGGSGQVKCYQIPSEGREIFTRMIENCPVITNFIAVELLEQNDQLYIILVLSSGQIFKSTALNLLHLEESLCNNSSIVENVHFYEVIDVKEMNSQVLTVFSLLKERGSIFIGAKQNMCMVHMDDFNIDLNTILDGYKIEKVCGGVNNSVLFVLCEKGLMLQICLYTMTLNFLFTEFPVKDFVVLDGNNVYECNLLALVDESLHGQAIAVFSWPDFKMRYKLPVADASYLIYQKGAEDILFMEGFGSDGVPDTIRIKSIFESQPDLRLERILRRCKFEEAERFARAFGLDLEIVYKAHAQRLCQDLLPWRTEKETQKEIFNKILELIEKIKDDRFVASVCASAIPPDFTLLHTMLMYGVKRFSKVTDEADGSLGELLACVSKIARRLDTCMLIHGAATTVDHWIQFPKHDLAISCLNHLKRGEIREAILIWSRHLSDIKYMFTPEKAGLLLNGIPKASTEELQLWLQHFVPPILAMYPHFLNDVVQWTIQRARDLEISDGGVWPASGLSLAQCLLALVHTPHAEPSVLRHSQRTSLRHQALAHQSPLHQLLQLIDTLNDISQLKLHYGLNIKYDQYIQDDHSSFVAVLLEGLPLEKISSFMTEFFHRLMTERKLDPDAQILHFIQDIVMNYEHWWFWDEAPWEMRVAALIPYINNIQVKLAAIMHVLKSAPVPWTATVAQLAEQGVGLPHFMANDVRNECNDVPKRLIIKKYGILIDQKQEMLLVRIILKKNQESMMDDINVLAKCVKGDKTDVYLPVIIHLLENGEENKARDVLKAIDEEQREECISRLLFHMHILVTHNSWDKLSAYFRFMPAINSEKEKQLFFELKNIFSLKMEFNIATTCHKMSVPNERHNILDNYAEKLAKEVASAIKTEVEAVKSVQRLAYLLQLVGEEGLVVLSSVCLKYSLQLALNLTSNIEDMENKPDRVYKKVSALISLLVLSYKPIENHNTVIEMFSVVIYNIAKRFLTYSSEYKLNDICRWVCLLNHSSSNTRGKAGASSVYADPAPTGATAVLVHSSAKHIVNTLQRPHTHGNNHMAKNESVNSVLSFSISQNPEIAVEIRELMEVWRRLKEEQQDLSCIRLLCEYCWAQKIANHGFQENSLDSFLVLCIKDLTRKLFRMRNFDVELALSLLHFFEKDIAMGFLDEEAKSVGYNYQRLSAISQLALTYSSVNKIDKDNKRFREHHVACKWAKRLNELGLPYKDAFKNTEAEHKLLILKLLALPSTNIILLKEFSLDMRFDQQECLMMYLEYLLLNWEPNIQITINPSSGEKVMMVKNSEDELLQQCRAILQHLGTRSSKSDGSVMTWSESIQKDVCNLWNKVNCYYYEVYSVLVQLYQRVLTQQEAVKQINCYQTMLQFLIAYTRISSPSETEQEQWFQLFPNTNQLPLISNFRLPFTPFFVKEPPWSIIKPELSLKTYKMWYNIIPHLGLDRDMLCTLTIQRQTSEQLAGGVKNKSSWRLQACNSSVLQEIQECVRNIRNQEMASAALYYVVNHMPPGADQAAAALLCYRQAEHWLTQDCSDKAKAGFAKVQKKYLTVSTSHILHSSGLGKPEYLQLVLHPLELICALYDDPSILQRNTGSISHCPDINGVVIEIGKLHQVNVLGIQQELLSEWLCPPDCPPLDMSCDDITQNIAAINSNPLATTDNLSIVRACYVLESMDVETAAKYLVSYAGLRDEGECRATTVRLRALQCLCSIASEAVVAATTGTTLNTIKENMQHLTFISELEKLGLVWSIKGFEGSDKEDVVRILLVKGSPHAVQVAAAMGCTYKLTNIHYWDQILQLMTNYGMFEELSILLPELTCFAHLLNNSIFIGAWNAALITPFQKAEVPLGEEARCRVLRSLELLYCCPVPRQLDLATLLSHCQRLHTPQLIARIQPFLNLSSVATVKQETLFLS